jgi:hypothetical protein
MSRGGRRGRPPLTEADKLKQAAELLELHHLVRYRPSELARLGITMDQAKARLAKRIRDPLVARHVAADLSNPKRSVVKAVARLAGHFIGAYPDLSRVELAEKARPFIPGCAIPDEREVLREMAKEHGPGSSGKARMNKTPKTPQ